MIKAILAVGENGEIGQNGDMPWGRSLPKDLEYFKEQTLGDAVVMGRKTFDSLPFKKGFPKRHNAVLTTKNLKGVYRTLLESLTYCNNNQIKEVFDSNLLNIKYWLVGGATIYEQFWDYVEEAHITRVKSSFPEADTFFTPDLSNFEKVGEDIDVSGADLKAYVEVWKRKK